MDPFSYVLGSFIALVVLLLTVAYLYLTWHYGTLEKLGIPVLKPVWCLGSIPGVYRRIQQFDDMEYLKKFGRVWGLYDGRTPVIFVADPDLLKQIFLKDFNYFYGPRDAEIRIEGFKEGLSFLHAEKWKTVRTALSPVFTSNKLKSISKIMTDIVSEYMKGVREDVSGDEVVNITNMYGNVVMEVIASCIFGTKLSYKDRQNEFARNAVKLTVSGGFRSPIFLLFSLFPITLSMINFFDAKSIKFFNSVSERIMKERREHKKKYGDFVDLLNELYSRLDESDFKRLGITKRTLYSQAVTFFIAGFATTTMTLSVATYFLAKHSEIQKRATAEVDRVVEEHGDISYETIGHLEYLNACINETTRLSPALIRAERLCNKEWTSEDGSLTIPKGTVVKAPVFAMHRNSDFFPNPEEFDPERFLGGQQINPYAFLPFGFGPRSCIGMRFALEEMKIVLAKMLQNFQFSICPESKLKILPGIMSGIEPILLEQIKLKMEHRVGKA